MGNLGVPEMLIVFLLFGTIVPGVLIAWGLYTFLSRIPPRYRQVPPNQAWLIIIPLAGVVFQWILIPFKIPQSVMAYFEGRASRPSNLGDGGATVGLWFAICLTACIIPFINLIAWLPALVLIIAYVVKLNDLTNWIARAELVSQPQSTPETSVQHPSSISGDKLESLSKLKKLFDDGALTAQEFESEKKKILG